MSDRRKSDTEVHVSLVLVPVAVVVTLVSGFLAWKLASGQFSPAPTIGPPGEIAFATYGHPANQNPISVGIEYDASASPRSEISYSLTFLQQGNAEESKIDPTDVAIFLGGAADLRPDFIHYIDLGVKQQLVSWYSASIFRGFSLFGYNINFPDDCSFALIPLEFYPASNNSSAIMVGHSGEPSSEISGSGAIYAWPGIFNLPQANFTKTFTVTPLANGSTYTVRFLDLPDDISNVVTHPTLTSSPEGFQIAGPFNYGFTNYYDEFRLSGDLSNSQATGQRDLFIAGALVGVTGGAAIWLLELLSKVLFGLKRTPVSENADVANTRKEETKHVDEGLRKDGKSGSGLGWPG